MNLFTTLYSLTDDNLTGEHTIEFKSGGLVGVENLQIYIPENMTKNRKTEIESITIIGAPVSMTNYANLDSSSTATKSFSIIPQSANSGASQVSSMPHKGSSNVNEASSAKKKIESYM